MAADTVNDTSNDPSDDPSDDPLANDPLANDPLGAKSQSLRLSDAKLKALQPELYSSRSWRKFLREEGYHLSSPNEDPDYWKEHIAENLRRGDTDAAVVVAKTPLLIAAFARELDCVAMLSFSGQFASKYDLQIGARLLAINYYLEWKFFLPEDLSPGPNQTGKYRNFAPLIAEFLTDDSETLQRMKAEITDVEWRRVEEFGQEYLKLNNGKARDGRPLLCHLPAKTRPKTRRRQEDDKL